MIGYVYALDEEVADILAHGYLSARRVLNKFGEGKFIALIRKYQRQYEEAMSSKEYGDSLNQFNLNHGNKTLIDCILGYLDWRDEATLRGSDAIYFLFAPIPSTVLRRFNKLRSNFTHGRTLLKLHIHAQRIRVVENTENKPAEWYATQSHEYWAKMYQETLQRSTSQSLWFEGIPHGYVIPRDGRVAVTLG